MQVGVKNFVIENNILDLYQVSIKVNMSWLDKVLRRGVANVCCLYVTSHGSEFLEHPITHIHYEMFAFLVSNVRFDSQSKIWRVCYDMSGNYIFLIKYFLKVHASNNALV